MSTKSESRIKDMIREALNEKNETINTDLADNVYGILFIGFLLGIVTVYIPLFPFGIGAMVGYGAAKRDNPVIASVYTNGMHFINKASTVFKLSTDN